MEILYLWAPGAFSLEDPVALSFNDSSSNDVAIDSVIWRPTSKFERLSVEEKGDITTRSCCTTTKWLLIKYIPDSINARVPVPTAALVSLAAIVTVSSE